MVRPLRIEFDGAIYHVLQRGFRRERVFCDDSTKHDYMEYLHEFSIRFNLEIYAWCLMDNHVHLLLSTKEANLSRFMHSLNASFANSRKRFRSLDGSIFAGRYKALLVDSDAWLLQLSYYIHLNPLRARMVDNPLEYKWSSCIDYFVSPKKRRYGVMPEKVLNLLDGKINEQLDSYKKLLLEDGGIELPPVYRSVGYGNCNLTELMDEYINQINGNIEHPKLTRKQISPEKILQLVLQVTNSFQEELYKSKNHNLCRQLACYTLRKHTQLTLNEIGTHLKMSYNSVSNTTRLFERKLKTEKKYSEVLKELQKLL